MDRCPLCFAEVTPPSGPAPIRVHLLECPNLWLTDRADVDAGEDPLA